MALSRRAFLTNGAAAATLAGTSVTAQTSYPSLENGVVDAEKYLRDFFNSHLGQAVKIDRIGRYTNLANLSQHTRTERQEFNDLAYMFEVINNFEDNGYRNQSLNVRLKTAQCLMGNMVNSLDTILIPGQNNSSRQTRDHMLLYYNSLDRISPLDGQINCRRLYQQLAR